MSDNPFITNTDLLDHTSPMAKLPCSLVAPIHTSPETNACGDVLVWVKAHGADLSKGAAGPPQASPQQIRGFCATTKQPHSSDASSEAKQLPNHFSRILYDFDAMFLSRTVHKE